MTDHYIECRNPDCAGCLPTDDDVRAMSRGRVAFEAALRGLRGISNVEDRRDAILDDADDYRARSAQARA